MWCLYQSLGTEVTSKGQLGPWRFSPLLCMESGDLNHQERKLGWQIVSEIERKMSKINKSRASDSVMTCLCAELINIVSFFPSCFCLSCSPRFCHLKRSSVQCSSSSPFAECWARGAWAGWWCRANPANVLGILSPALPGDAATPSQMSLLVSQAWLMFSWVWHCKPHQ